MPAIGLMSAVVQGRRLTGILARLCMQDCRAAGLVFDSSQSESPQLHRSINPYDMCSGDICSALRWWSSMLGSPDVWYCKKTRNEECEGQCKAPQGRTKGDAHRVSRLQCLQKVHAALFVSIARRRHGGNCSRNWPIVKLRHAKPPPNVVVKDFVAWRCKSPSEQACLVRQTRSPSFSLPCEIVCVRGYGCLGSRSRQPVASLAWCLRLPKC